jgi:hypothetical protein
MMRVDEKATTLARERHAVGIKTLRELFDPHRIRLNRAETSIQHGNARPVRLRPGVPPMRDADHQARHRKRKTARASRKRNRST